MGSTGTRKGTEVWLVGQPLIDPLAGSKLPTTREVLRRVFGLRQEDPYSTCRTVRDCCRLVVEELMPFWKKSGVPLQEARNATDRVVQLYDDWQALCRSRHRSSPTNLHQRKKFTECLDKAFDFAHQNAVTILQKKVTGKGTAAEKAAAKEDLDFYHHQMTDRQGVLGTRDMNPVKKFKREQRKAAKHETLKRRHEADRIKVKRQFEKSNEGFDGGSDQGSPEKKKKQDDPDFVIPENYRKKKIKIQPLSPTLLQSLDRNAVSDRKAARTIRETAVSLGVNPKEIKASYATTRRHRQQSRAKALVTFPSTFTATGPLAVHWDGKSLKNDKGRFVEHVAVVVVNIATGEELVLGFVPISDASGATQAGAVVKLLVDRGLDGQVVALVCDTTASNTSPSIGACVLIEKKLGRKLLRMDCRHHILELPVKNGFAALNGPSKSPDVELFSRFKASWDDLDQTDFISLGRIQAPAMRRISDLAEIIQFCKQQLQLIHPRDDYKHLLEYCILFLGGVPPGGIKFYKPGPVNKARFMGYALYCLVISMFSHQFDLSPEEKATVVEVSIFIVTAYIRPWIQANDACSAPRNDLEYLIKMASQYLKIKNQGPRKVMWGTAGRNFLGHLQYLSTYMVAAALLDPEVDDDTKAAMVVAMEKEPVDEEATHAVVVSHLDSRVLRLKLQDFVDSRSRSFFTILGVQPEFLLKPIPSWSTDTSYLKMKAILKNLPVTNDAAERAVKLGKDFHNVLTKDPVQKQGLYVTVANDRKAVVQT